MSVGIVLISHPGIASSIKSVAERIFGNLPLRVEVLEVGFDGRAADWLPSCSTQMRKVDQGDGVLLLVDLYGSTPSNCAKEASMIGTPTRRVSGLNLSMLMRVLNYPELDLDGLQAMAAQGARIGVVLDDA